MWTLQASAAQMLVVNSVLELFKLDEADAWRPLPENNDNVAHLVLDKAIYELSIVFDMICRAQSRPDY